MILGSQRRNSIVCASITGKVSNRLLLKFLNDHQELCREYLVLQDMDPGRYGLQQGWENNSVIVVSFLITYNG